MPNRPSEPQIVADRIDQIIPFLRLKLRADGEIDRDDRRILETLSEISDQAQRHAEVLDISASLLRLGVNERNRRRLRDIGALTALPSSAA